MAEFKGKNIVLGENNGCFFIWVAGCFISLWLIGYRRGRQKMRLVGRWGWGGVGNGDPFVAVALSLKERNLVTNLSFPVMTGFMGKVHSTFAPLETLALCGLASVGPISTALRWTHLEVRHFPLWRQCSHSLLTLDTFLPLWCSPGLWGAAGLI